MIIVILQVVSNSPSTSNWTILAAIAASISAISAFRSSLIAKRSLQFASKNYQDRQSNFSIYLIEGYRLTNKDHVKVLLFHITISNKSDSKSSFKSNLQIEYVREDNLVARVIIPHNDDLKKHISRDISVFPNDIRVEEKGMQSKWLIFEQPINAFQEFRIEKYSIKLTDALGDTEISDVFIIKEINNETKN